MAAKPKSKTPTKATATIARHPLSEKFALPISDDERAALAHDMQTNGQHQEIILYEGQVLDGWERYLGCVKSGIEPKFKTYDGPNPAAVAFGANAIRRKLNSVQKALFGAKYFLHSEVEGVKLTQKDVAKSACCSLQRLNEIVQLLRKVDTNAAAAKCAATLSTDPDVTTAMLQDMLADAGVIDINARKPPPKPADDDMDDDILGGDNADDTVDLLGGADIDDLLDDDDEPASARVPTPKGDKGNNTGTRIGVDKRPHESPASKTARDFRALTEPERIDFVKFAWAMLRPAIEACVEQKRVSFPMLGGEADPGTAALADVAGVLTKAAKSSAAAIAPKPSKATVAAQAAAHKKVATKQGPAGAPVAPKPASKARSKASKATA